MSSAGTSEYKMFQVSMPGYFFPEVEEAVRTYKQAIQDGQQALQMKESKILEYQLEIERLTQEIFNQRLALEAIEDIEIEPSFFPNKLGF